MLSAAVARDPPARAGCDLLCRVTCRLWRRSGRIISLTVNVLAGWTGDSRAATSHENGQTRSIVLERIQLLSSSFKNFISSRTTVSARR
jgi:hypothetical protein